MKKITICNKEYDIDCNALTYVKYQSFFKSGILKDMSIVEAYLIKQDVYASELEKEEKADANSVSVLSEMLVNDLDEFVRIITQITWILMYSANDKIDSYENWLKSIDKFKVDDEWIVEVTEYAVDCFCR